MNTIPKVTFCGGTGLVTGANFLFEVDGKKILVDCGMFQGSRDSADLNTEPFPYDPSEIDILFISHAHIDHIGRIPKLIADGFKGEIYSTPPTRDLSVPMLQDTIFIINRYSKKDLSGIFNEKNLDIAMSRWKTLDYKEVLNVTKDLKVSLWNAGHILGSSMTLFEYFDKRIMFTGDLGNSPSPILPDNDELDNVDYLIMESVYGDRNHESRESRKKMLAQVLEDNHKRGGALLIPTFSLERSQELLFELNNLVENKRIPTMPIFFDSPLAIKVTEIFKKYKEDYLNDAARKVMVHDKYIFDFPGLHSTLHSKESKTIKNAPNPKVILAGSGMSVGGRIVHHEKYYLPDPNNTILLIGYQAVGTPGRHIQEGIKKVRINGAEVPVRAHIATILGYSGHKDSDSLLKFVEGGKGRLKKVFAVMGEPKSAMYLAQKIRDNLGINAIAPELGDSFELL